MKTFLIYLMLAFAIFACRGDNSTSTMAAIDESTNPTTVTTNSTTHNTTSTPTPTPVTVTNSSTTENASVSSGNSTTVNPTPPSTSTKPSSSTSTKSTSKISTTSLTSTSHKITSTAIPPTSPSKTPSSPSTPFNQTATSTNSTSSPNISTSSSVTSKSSASTQTPSESSQSAGSTQSSSPAPTVSPPKVQISETNIKTWNGNATSSSWFIELSGPANQSLTGLVLRVLNGAENNVETLLSLNLTGELDANGLYLLNREDSTDFENKLDDVQEVLLLLSVQDASTTVLDHLLYGTTSEPNFAPSLKEEYQPTGTSELIININSFDAEVNVSVSRCSADQEGFVLAPETPGLPNKCKLDFIQVLQMKLTLQIPECDTTNHPDAKKLKASLMNQIINGVNMRRMCGFTPIMLPDFSVKVNCKGKDMEVAVRFTVHAAFQHQIHAIMDGYQIFVNKTKTIVLDHKSYSVLNCIESCFKIPVPHDNNGGDSKIKVTIAVVVSCIGVFLVIVLFVIIYMKRKRRGILQFRMTRLDEDDDDLIGDMDDFVGNQGPTFSNFK